VLDKELSPSQAQHTARSTALDPYSQLLRATKRSFTTPDAVLDALSSIVNHFKLHEAINFLSYETDNEHPRSTQPVNYESGFDNWGSFLLRRPANYLRLVLKVDLFLCNGKLPHDNELPPFLRLQQLSTCCSLHPITFGYQTASTSSSAAIVESCGREHGASVSEEDQGHVRSYQRSASDAPLPMLIGSSRTFVDYQPRASLAEDTGSFPRHNKYGHVSSGLDFATPSFLPFDNTFLA
jgi:hypothetical protein